MIVLSSLLKCLSKTTNQQTLIFNKIIQAVDKQEGVMFFLYGYEGTGKKFHLEKASKFIESKQKNYSYGCF